MIGFQALQHSHYNYAHHSSIIDVVTLLTSHAREGAAHHQDHPAEGPAAREWRQQVAAEGGGRLSRGTEDDAAATQRIVLISISTNMCIY